MQLYLDGGYTQDESVDYIGINKKILHESVKGSNSHIGIEKWLKALWGESFEELYLATVNMKDEDLDEKDT